MRKLWLALVVPTLFSCATLPNVELAASQAGSFVLAQNAFEDNYSAWGKNYRARKSRVTKAGEDCFFFEGLGPFARPGYNATICVARNDSSIRIVGGE